MFPPDFISTSENIGNSSFENIMDEELALIRSIEKKAESRAKNKTLWQYIPLCLQALGVAIIGFVFNKFRRNIDNKFFLLFHSMTLPLLNCDYFSRTL